MWPIFGRNKYTFNIPKDTVKTFFFFRLKANCTFMGIVLSFSRGERNVFAAALSFFSVVMVINNLASERSAGSATARIGRKHPGSEPAWRTCHAGAVLPKKGVAAAPAVASPSDLFLTLKLKIRRFHKSSTAGGPWT